ncbi:MAG TPA: DUF1330 domain-containing protein [Mycobacteriales bacterium]|nr:DUF1330 domain-containing protein [Mycobacteriales bacterium]
MTAYVVLDVDIQDPDRYQEFMAQAAPALEAAGGRYLVRGGVHRVYEGDWEPRRLVVLDFPSLRDWERFYFGETYQKLKRIRDEASTGRLVAVEGVATVLAPSR